MADTTVKISIHELKKTMRYRKMINNTSFDDLDFSEFKTFKDVSEEDIIKFKTSELNNIDFIQMYLSKELNV